MVVVDAGTLQDVCESDGAQYCYLKRVELWAVRTPEWCSQLGLCCHFIELAKAALWAHLQLCKAVWVVSLQGRAGQIR